MTLEELCDCSADQLEKLSQVDLEKILSPYLNVTRPERVVRISGESRLSEQTKAVFLSPGKVAALKSLQDVGIDLEFLKNTKRRK